MWLGDSMVSYMYGGMVLLYSAHDNLHFVPTFGPNSIRQPLFIVSTSNFYSHSTLLVCFPDPPSILYARDCELSEIQINPAHVPR